MKVKLSPIQWARLWLFGRVSVGTRMRSGWKAPIEHFAFRCTEHGVVVAYPHGKGGLRCPRCLEDDWKYA